MNAPVVLPSVSMPVPEGGSAFCWRTRYRAARQHGIDGLTDAHGRHVDAKKRRARLRKHSRDDFRLLLRDVRRRLGGRAHFVFVAAQHRERDLIRAEPEMLL